MKAITKPNTNKNKEWTLVYNFDSKAGKEIKYVHILKW
jgi:hypothetical protein